MSDALVTFDAGFALLGGLLHLNCATALLTGVHSRNYVNQTISAFAERSKLRQLRAHATTISETIGTQNPTANNVGCEPPI